MSFSPNDSTLLRQLYNRVVQLEGRMHHSKQVLCTSNVTHECTGETESLPTSQNGVSWSAPNALLERVIKLQTEMTNKDLFIRDLQKTVHFCVETRFHTIVFRSKQTRTPMKQC